MNFKTTTPLLLSSSLVSIRLQIFQMSAMCKVYCIYDNYPQNSSLTPQRTECKHGSFCSIFIQLSENHTLQNSLGRWGRGKEQGSRTIYGHFTVTSEYQMTSQHHLCTDFSKSFRQCTTQFIFVSDMPRSFFFPQVPSAFS